MSTTTETQESIRKRLAELRTLADDVRVRIHLGGMEARSAWEKLQPKLDRVEQDATRAGETMAKDLTHAFDELRTGLERIKEQVQRGVGAGSHDASKK